MKSFAVACLLNQASALTMKSKWSIGLDGEEDLGEEIIINGEPFRFHQKETSMAQLHEQSPEDFILKPKEALPRKQWTAENMDQPEERVSILEPVIAKTHTTFYDKQNRMWRQAPTNLAVQDPPPNLVRQGQSGAANNLADPNVGADAITPRDYDPWVFEFSKEHMGAAKAQYPGMETSDEAPVQDPRYHHAYPAGDYPSFAQNAPEKVHVLEPKVYQNRANTNKPNTRTTFYNRQSFAQVQEDGDAVKAEQAAERAEVQADTDAVDNALKMNIGDPSEKTSILEPLAYENRYNYYLPYMRTTYYAQKN